MAERVHPPIHPGEVLRDELLEPMGLSDHALARDLGVPLGCITAIIEGKRSVTADTALRLGRYFGTTAELWMNMQAAWDREVTRDPLEDDPSHIEPRKRG